MQSLRNIEEIDPFLFIKTILDPENNQTSIPDDVISKVLVRNDSSNYMVTSPGGEGSFTVEFYPESTNEVVGAFFLYDQAQGRDVWSFNIMRSAPLKDDYNWIRSVAKVLKLRLNSRTMDRDYISGRMSAVESQVGISEVGSALTYSNLLGVVSNAENKKSVNINEGLVCVSLPERLDKEFIRLKDDASYTVNTVPGGVPAGDTKVNLTSEGGVIVRANYSDVINYTTPNAWQDVSSRTFNAELLQNSILNITQRLTPGTTITSTLYTRYLIQPYDLMGDPISAPIQVANNEEAALLAAMPIDKTYNSMKAPIDDLTLHDAAPIHSFKVTVQMFNGAAISGLIMNTQLYFTSNGGPSYENLRPVHIIKGQGLPADSVLEVTLHTVDEVIPNGSLQRNTTLLHPNFSPIAKKIAVMLIAHGVESGIKPFYTFEEHEEIVKRYSNITLTDDDQKIVMEASSSNWMKTLSKVLRGAKKVYKVARPLLEQTPVSSVLPISDVLLNSASKPAFQQRRYYAADTDDLRRLEIIIDNTEDIPTVTYHKQKDDTAVLFPAVFTSGNTAVVGTFVALSGDKTVLEGSKRRRHFRKTKGKQKVFGLFNTSDRLQLKLKDDVTILPVKQMTDNTLEVYTVGPTLDGNSLKAAIKIAGNYKGIWNKDYLVSADVFEQREDTILLPVGEVARKADYAKKIHRKLITTRSSLPGTINKTYVRQVAYLLRDSQGSGTLLPDEAAKNPIQADFSMAYASNQFTITERERELIEQLRKTTVNTEYLIFKCADKQPAFKQQRPYDLQEQQIEEEEDPTEKYQQNLATAINNLDAALARLTDPNTVGVAVAKKYEILSNLMGLLENIFSETEYEDYDDVDGLIGRHLTHFSRYKAFPATTPNTPFLDNMGFKSWDWLRQASEQEVPAFKELDKKVQERVKQFPFIFLNQRLANALSDDRPITNGMVNRAKNGNIRGANDEEQYLGDLNNLTRIAVKNQIEPTPENFVALVDILDVKKEDREPINMTKEQQRLVTELKTGKEVKSRSKVTINPDDDDQVRKALEGEGIEVAEETIDKFRKLYSTLGNSWSQSIQWKPYRLSTIRKQENVKKSLQPQQTTQSRRISEIKASSKEKQNKTAEIRKQLAAGAQKKGKPVVQQEEL